MVLTVKPDAKIGVQGKMAFSRLMYLEKQDFEMLYAVAG
jgi:hypothetical protein